jgi:hypothetical protein
MCRFLSLDRLLIVLSLSWLVTLFGEPHLPSRGLPQLARLIYTCRVGGADYNPSSRFESGRGSVSSAPYMVQSGLGSS